MSLVFFLSNPYKEVFIVGCLVCNHRRQVTEKYRVERDAIDHPKNADHQLWVGESTEFTEAYCSQGLEGPVEALQVDVRNRSILFLESVDPGLFIEVIYLCYEVP